MLPSRRDFLERLAAGAAAVTTVASFDSRAAFGAAPDSSQEPDAWDTSWTTRIVGAHRAVFDATEIEDGFGLLRAMIWRQQYGQVLKVAPGDMTAVVVVRHNAIPLAMNQEFWDRYQIGKTKKVKHPFTGARITKNPVLLTTEAGDLSHQFASLNLAGLQKAGGITLACNLAFSQCIDTIAKAEKVDDAEARKRAVAMLNPGIMLQPSGVFATILAQEQGCQYLKAS